MAKNQSPEGEPLFYRSDLVLIFSENGYKTLYPSGLPFPITSGSLYPSEDDAQRLLVDTTGGAELNHAVLYAAYIAYGLKKKVSLTSSGEPIEPPIEISPEDAEMSEPLDQACAAEVLSRFETIEGTVGLRDESKLVIGAMARAAYDSYIQDVHRS